MTWFMTLSSAATNAETAPWVPVIEGDSGIMAIINSETERVLSIMLTQERELLVTYTNYDGTDPVIDWKVLGKFNEDGTVDINEPTEWDG